MRESEDWKGRRTRGRESELHLAQERRKEREKESVGPTNLGRREIDRGGESG
jgi:hypothetical protein